MPDLWAAAQSWEAEAFVTKRQALRDIVTSMVRVERAVEAKAAPALRRRWRRRPDPDLHRNLDQWLLAGLIREEVERQLAGAPAQESISAMVAELRQLAS